MKRERPPSERGTDPVEALVGIGAAAGDRALRALRDATTDPALLCRAMWRGLRTDRLSPTTDDWWRRMAVDPAAFDAEDVVALFVHLQARAPNLASPGRDGQPPGWRDALGPLLAPLPDLEPLRALAAASPEPWASGLLEGVRRVEQARGGLDTLVGDGEPDWAGLEQHLRVRPGDRAEVCDRLVARGWYAEDVPAFLEHDRRRWPTWDPAGGPRALPADEAPPVTIPEPDELRALVAGFDPAGGRAVSGPPDWVAVSAVAGSWTVRVDGARFEVHAVDLAPGAVVRADDEDSGWLEFEHRGGRTSVWAVGGDGEHGPTPRLLARDLVTLLREARGGVAPAARRAPRPRPARDVKAPGAPRLAAWLAALPGGFPVVDLRKAATPVSSPPLDRCGEVVLAGWPDPGALAVAAAIEGRTPEAAAAALGLHPIALARRLADYRLRYGPWIEAGPS